MEEVHGLNILFSGGGGIFNDTEPVDFLRDIAGVLNDAETAHAASARGSRTRPSVARMTAPREVRVDASGRARIQISSPTSGSESLLSRLFRQSSPATSGVGVAAAATQESNNSSSQPGSFVYHAVIGNNNGPDATVSSSRPSQTRDFSNLRGISVFAGGGNNPLFSFSLPSSSPARSYAANDNQQGAGESADTALEILDDSEEENNS